MFSSLKCTTSIPTFSELSPAVHLDRYAALPTLTSETTTFSDLWLAGVPFVSYVLLASGICTALSIFTELKSPDEDGLIMGLIVGLIEELA